jgi:hypothetical protein
MGGLVGSAPACYGSSLGSNTDISQKYKWATVANEWPIHSSPPKKYKRPFFINAQLKHCMGMLTLRKINNAKKQQ